MISAFRQSSRLLQTPLKNGSRSMASLAHRRFMMKRQTSKVAGVNHDIAASLPLTPQEMDNSSLVTLSALKNHEARVEVVKRHIMATDKVSYAQACETFKEIDTFNRQGLVLLSIPYQIGVVAAMTAALSSIPLCFHLDTVQWFNEHYVTTDVPEPADLETWLEVGSWSWNWMEPPLGQISFFLLCLSFSRAQIQNLGIKPFTASMQQRRALRLVNQYPQYNAKVLSDFSKSAGFYRGSLF